MTEPIDDRRRKDRIVKTTKRKRKLRDALARRRARRTRRV